VIAIGSAGIQTVAMATEIYGAGAGAVGAVGALAEGGAAEGGGLKVLELAGGRRPMPGTTTNIDKIVAPEVDITHDLTKLPWPVADGEFDAVQARLLPSPLAASSDVLSETHRVLRSGGTIDLHSVSGVSAKFWEQGGFKITYVNGDLTQIRGYKP
jgi:SAM-dependent methyltransferase